MRLNLRKLTVLADTALAGGRSRGGSVLTNAGADLGQYDGVLFFMDEPAYMHLGDQFFFRPLITKLTEHGVSVVVRPTPAMAPLFAPHVAPLPDRPERWVIVSRSDLRPLIREQFGAEQPHILFNTMARAVDRPVSNYILSAFADHFALPDLPTPIRAADYLPADFTPPVDSAVVQQVTALGPVVALNNYIDSGQHRLTPARRDHLIETMRREKGARKAIHLGSAGDKAGDERDYGGLIDLDLRGRTTLLELIAILSLKTVQAVYCHDTFVLHLANLYDIPARVSFRRHYLPGATAQKRRAFACLFEKPLRTITFLD